MANKPQNVQIPIELFNAVLDLFEHMDVSDQPPGFKDHLENVLEALRYKKAKMDQRDNYSRLISANRNGDEDEQYHARIEYLKNRPWRST